jgi:predicted transcriptional regulator of viral defense system
LLIFVKRRGLSEVQALIAATAAEQFGLINHTQLLQIGLSEDAIYRWVKSGRLERVLPGVCGIPGTPRTWERDLMAACLWAAKEVAVSGPPAAALWRLADIQRTGVEIATVSSRRPHGLPFRIRRIGSHLRSEIASSGEGIPVTSVRRTVLDLYARRHPRAQRALDDALFRKLEPIGRFWTFYDQEWTRGQRGIALLRLSLEERTPGKAPTQTVLEDLFVGIVERFNLPNPIRQFPLTLHGKRIRADFAYPDLWIWIECDSHSRHGDWSAAQADRDRDNELQLLGWKVLRFPWALLRYEPEKVAAMVKAHIEAAA